MVRLRHLCLSRSFFVLTGAGFLLRVVGYVVLGIFVFDVDFFSNIQNGTSLYDSFFRINYTSKYGTSYEQGGRSILPTFIVLDVYLG